jgi:AAA15 family ATPase/GTPase
MDFNMKLVTFRIKNFRSIIDTNWQSLSVDNLTSVIGQNESGKSAILDALFSFYSPTMEDDSLRSDGTLPEINCVFEISRQELIDIFQDKELPRGLQSQLTKNKWKISLCRKWTELETSSIELNDTPIMELLLNQEEEARKTAERLAQEKAEAQAKIDATAVAEEATDIVTTVEDTVVVAETETPETEIIEETPEADPIPTVLGYRGFVDILLTKIPEFVMFTDNASFLPDTIDLDAIIQKKTSTDGYIGARNFLDLTGLTIEDLLLKSRRRSGVKIRTANKKLTIEFHEFWQQFIGKEDNKAQIEVELKNYDNDHEVKANIGKPYLVFWVKNGEELLHPNQRSKGLRWFLSFFLQLRASALPNSKDQVLLIDEPGQSLHIKAQKDILKVFEKSRRTFQIIYTTHSPYLIEAESLHRILAVQRSGEGDTGESEVFSARQLARANIDTLFPIYSLIGADLGSQAVIERNNNVILEEPSAFYYIKSFLHLLNETYPVQFLPATGVTNVRTFVNLFLGWGIDFLVVVDGDREANAQVKLIEDNVYGGKTDESGRHIMQMNGFEGIEDIFTKGDFKKYILKDTSASFTGNNSNYLKTTSISKPLLAIDFHKRVKDNELTIDSLAPTTQQAIRELVTGITDHLKALKPISSLAVIEENPLLVPSDLQKIPVESII